MSARGTAPRVHEVSPTSTALHIVWQDSRHNECSVIQAMAYSHGTYMNESRDERTTRYESRRGVMGKSEGRSRRLIRYEQRRTYGMVGTFPDKDGKAPAESRVRRPSCSSGALEHVCNNAWRYQRQKWQEQDARARGLVAMPAMQSTQKRAEMRESRATAQQASPVTSGRDDEPRQCLMKPSTMAFQIYEPVPAI